MPDPVLTEEQVRERLTRHFVWGQFSYAAQAIQGHVHSVENNPGEFPVLLEAVGVRWTGEQYIEVTDV